MLFFSVYLLSTLYKIFLVDQHYVVLLTRLIVKLAVLYLFLVVHCTAKV